MLQTPSSKPDVRRMFLDRRLQIPLAQREKSAAEVLKIFFQHVPVPANAVVAGYWPVRGELDDMPILQELSRRGYVCALPHVAGKGQALAFHAWDEETPMTTGKYGIAEPHDKRAVGPDIVLVPLVAFDARGHRLGYGAGFYDRTISRMKATREILAVGLAYEEQKCDTLPTEEHDVRMDMIVTDKNIYTCKGSGL